MTALAPTITNSKFSRSSSSLSCNDLAGSGVYDYGFRDYSPQQMRFTTLDPIRDGSNWYAYVGNDPINYIDPFGLREVVATDTGGQAIVVNPGEEVSRQSSVDLIFSKVSGKLEMEYKETINGRTVTDLSKSYSATNNQKERTPGVDEPVEFNGYHYYPEDMPDGEWNLTGTGYNSNKFVQNYIRTDAERTVDTYEKNIETGEWEKSGTTLDSGYLVHGGGYTATDGYDPYNNNLSSDNTWGCLRMDNEDVLEILPYIKDAIKTKGNDAKLKVKNK